MVIGVISDTHDNLPVVKKAFKMMKEMGIKIVIHCGDIVSPFVVEHFDCEKLFAVFGNNDGDRILLKERFEKKGFVIKKGPVCYNIEGKKILVMHEPDELEAFKNAGYDLILYGHTHKLDLSGNVINPGELSGWLSDLRTFVTIEIETLDFKVFYV
jgi:putative phosphoesterase|uniref:Phosphoesterase n=1 Tax=candidate division WOR-3 bacterium TaxID=2052148 RepID=A0A7C4YBX2_UNCW3